MSSELIWAVGESPAVISGGCFATGFICDPRYSGRRICLSGEEEVDSNVVLMKFSRCGLFDVCRQICPPGEPEVDANVGFILLMRFGLCTAAARDLVTGAGEWNLA